jgi:hypothetical protein
LITIVNIENKRFGVVPSCSVGLARLFFFYFLDTWNPRVFFYFLAGKSPVQPLLEAIEGVMVEKQKRETQGEG